MIRMVSKNSIEEAMLSCANYKLKLEQQMSKNYAGNAHGMHSDRPQTPGGGGVLPHDWLRTCVKISVERVCF